MKHWEEEGTNYDDDPLPYLVSDYGDAVELTVVRDGERRTVSVTLGERPDPEESA